MSEKQITHASGPNILQRGTQGMPEVERMLMLYNMIDKVRADLRAIVIPGRRDDFVELRTVAER